MAGGQALRILEVGKSGSGKSVLAGQIIEAFEGRFAYLVVCNKKTEFSDQAAPGARMKISDSRAITEKALFEFIVKHRRVFFWVVDPEAWVFMDKLGRVLMRLRHVLCVVDEAHNLLPQGKPCRGFVLAYTGGREQGLHFLIITQSVKADHSGLSITIQRGTTHVITFTLTQWEEVKVMRNMFPELGNRVANLKRPSPTDPNPPEYGVHDEDRGLGQVVLRTPGNPKRRVVQSL